MDGLIASSSRSAELAIGFARTLFLVVILARFIYQELCCGVGALATSRARIELPVLLSGIVISLLLLRFARRNSSPAVLAASAVLDALLCAWALLPGVLYPWETYRGLLRSPDTAVLPMLSASAGLRLSWGAYVAGASFNFFAFGTLVALDTSLHGPDVEYGPGETFLYACYLGIASVMGAILATRGRALAETAADSAAQAEAARAGLLRLLSSSHDLRSLLSAANIHAALASRGREREGDAHYLEALGENLQQLTEVLASSRDQAYAELARTEQVAAAHIQKCTERAGARLRLRFPELLITTRGADEVAVRFCGGEAGLERLLTNVLINAGEGDGTRGASQVRVEWQARERRVELSIADDGPGFPPQHLLPGAHYSRSQKTGGSGLGLLTCISMVEASHGTVRLSNAPNGGARVTIGLLSA